MPKKNKGHNRSKQHIDSGLVATLEREAEGAVADGQPRREVELAAVRASARADGAAAPRRSPVSSDGYDADEERAESSGRRKKDRRRKGQGAKDGVTLEMGVAGLGGAAAVAVAPYPPSSQAGGSSSRRTLLQDGGVAAAPARPARGGRAMEGVGHRGGRRANGGACGAVRGCCAVFGRVMCSYLGQAAAAAGGAAALAEAYDERSHMADMLVDVAHTDPTQTEEGIKWTIIVAGGAAVLYAGYKLIQGVGECVRPAPALEAPGVVAQPNPGGDMEHALAEAAARRQLREIAQRGRAPSGALSGSSSAPHLQSLERGTADSSRGAAV